VDPVLPSVRFEVTPASALLNVGEKSQFSAYRIADGVARTNITSEVTWEASLAGRVVSLGSKPGEIAGLFPGSALVTATLAGQGVIGTANVTVLNAPPPTAHERLIVSPLRSTVQVDRSIELNAKLYNTEGAFVDVSDAVTWSTTTPRILAVSANVSRATCLADGEGTIVGMQRNHAARAFVKCESTYTLVSLSLLPGAATLLVGETLFPRLHGTFADGGIRDLTDVAQWRLVPPQNGSNAHAKQVGLRSFIATSQGDGEIEASYGAAHAVGKFEVLALPEP
jgi:hypothetical protein